MEVDAPTSSTNQSEEAKVEPLVQQKVEEVTEDATKVLKQLMNHVATMPIELNTIKAKEEKLQEVATRVALFASERNPPSLKNTELDMLVQKGMKKKHPRKEKATSSAANLPTDVGAKRANRPGKKTRAKLKSKGQRLNPTEGVMAASPFEVKEPPALCLVETKRAKKERLASPSINSSSYTTSSSSSSCISALNAKEMFNLINVMQQGLLKENVGTTELEEHVKKVNKIIQMERDF